MTTRRSLASVAVAICTLMLLWSPDALCERQVLTPKRALETARIIDDPVSLSPSGNRFVLRLLRGDAARDGVWVEMWSGQLSSLASASVVKIAQFFTSGLGTLNPFAAPEYAFDSWTNPIHWISDSEVTFLAHDERGIRQVVTLDLRTGEFKWDTSADTAVMNFDRSKDGALIYNSLVSQSALTTSSELARAGFAIGQRTDGLAAIQGDFSGNSTLDNGMNSRWFIRSRSGVTQPVSMGDDGFDLAAPFGRTVRISPDGKKAIVSAQPRRIIEGWSNYQDSFLKGVIEQLRVDRHAERARRAIQLFVVDTTNGSSAPLWNAIYPLLPSDIAWSPDSRWLLIAPTFLPADVTDTPALSGAAAAVVNVETGKYVRLPIDLAECGAIRARWPSQSVIELQCHESKTGLVATFSFGAARDGWVRIRTATRQSSRMRVEIRQGLEDPPKVYAIDPATHNEKVVLDPNPGLLDDIELGRVERLTGRLNDGHDWIAHVFYPTQWSPRQKYPLVIQSSAASSHEFSLYGWQSGAGLGPSTIAVMPGQLLTQRQIAVATVDVPRSYGPNEGRLHAEAYESVVKQLVAAGLADEKRVGLVGFSRTGFHVEYALTHSDTPFAAAIVSDNYSASYGQAALSDWTHDIEYVVGAPPYAAGLQRWLQESPGFNADRVKAPLLMVGQSELRTSVLLAWELFSRLRHLGKPVEMYLMPQSDVHPAHCPQNPNQILALQVRAIDWFDFWLNGREDADRAKAEQYAQWRKLRQQRDDHLAPTSAVVEGH